MPRLLSCCPSDCRDARGGWGNVNWKFRCRLKRVSNLPVLPNHVPAHNRRDGLAFESPAMKGAVTGFARRLGAIKNPFVLWVKHRHVCVSANIQSAFVEEKQFRWAFSEFSDKLRQGHATGVIK